MQASIAREAAAFFGRNGRAIFEFGREALAGRARGEPYTPVALLLSYGHGHERVANYGKMMDTFLEDKSDLELRELFNVCWYPTGILEGQPAAPDLANGATA